MKLPIITLSGVDSHVTEWDVERLLAFPNVELGLLWSETNSDNRYLRAESIARIVERHPQRCAVHVCGTVAKELFLGVGHALGASAAQSGEMEASWLVRSAIVKFARRVQLNGMWEPYDRDKKTIEIARASGILAMAGSRVRWSSLDGVLVSRLCPVVITQWRPGEPTYTMDAAGSMPNQAILVDGSGGRGVVPETWSVPTSPFGAPLEVPIGFAGGLCLENLYAELPKILSVAKPGFWIDMETSLRAPIDAGPGRAGWFDAQRALDTVTTFNTLMERAIEHGRWTP